MGNRKITIQTLLKTAEANASAFGNLLVTKNFTRWLRLRSAVAFGNSHKSPFPFVVLPVLN